ncbi:MAG: hypothetical protein JEY96_15065 [Bacteroidales bacterium]|nr:hypothetical protein [Bacteroidales bacterium]
MNFYKRVVFHFILFIIVFFSIQLIIKQFFISESLLYEHLSEDFSDSSVVDKIENYKKVSFLQIIVPVIFYILRFAIIAGFLSAALFFYNIKFNYSKILFVTILAEYVYVIKQVIKLFWFGLIQNDFTLKEFYHFNWDSIGAWVDISKLEVYFRLPLNTVNLFTVFYVFALAYCLRRCQRMKYPMSLKITTQAFGAGLILWILLSMFILVLIS